LFPELVRDVLLRTGAAPARCWLGIPESAVAQDFDAASHVVSALHELGVGVALRDFGSVVSSLEQLRRLPAPTLMVAGPLVDALDASSEDSSYELRVALLSAIVNYARALGRIVVADGVRDARHAARLAELGCAFGVGPAFGPTIRPDQVEALLARGCAHGLDGSERVATGDGSTG
jgi:EAL domain-containing protein (putative c-di-GMP-specific phosphodiesterase class I)